MLLNLHSHLEGRLRPSTARELASVFGTPGAAGDWSTALELEAPADLTVYLEKVAASYPFFADGDAIARITREAVEDAAADGEAYLELRFGPATHARPGFSMRDVVRAACAGLAEGVASTGIGAGLVLAALRHHDDETNEAVARAAAEAAGGGVVGFDLAGDELRFPELDRFAHAFGIARAAGLGLTCHAAEAAPGTAAVRAVELFGVSRIGHGAHVASDPVALATLADAGVAIEVCPTSNVFTGAIARVADHPAPVFAAAGIPVVVGDDNPRQTGSLLSAEVGIVTGELGLDADRVAEASLAAAFLNDAERARLRAMSGGA